MIRLKADIERRCILIYIDNTQLPVLSRTLSKFLQAISHKVRPYRPEANEDLTGFEVLFVRVPQSKTVSETLALQERAIQTFLQDLQTELGKMRPSDLRVESCLLDPLVDVGIQEAALS